MPQKKADTQNSKCPQCGSLFHCSNSESCWCNTVKIPKEALNKPEFDSKNCLCPDCLQKLAEKSNLLY